MIEYVGPMTDAAINQLTKELKKKKHKDKIMKHVIDPILQDISNRFYPQFITVTVIFALIILLLIGILYVNIFSETGNHICTNCKEIIKSS
jgi:hypothetical protein